MTRETQFAESFIEDHLENDEAITQLQLNDLLVDSRERGLAPSEVEAEVRRLARIHKIKILRNKSCP